MPDPIPVQKLFFLLVEPSWRDALEDEFEKPYMLSIAEALEAAEVVAAEGGAMVAEPRPDIFRALNRVSIEKVRAVIVGQDPHPLPGDADGLAFRVRRDFKLPNALGKVLAEVRRNLGWKGRTSGNLTPWADAGVLLVNAALTNLVGYTWAHGDLDWQRFPETLVGDMADRKQEAVILLWGREAAKFGSVFDGTNHKVLRSDHPCASRTIVDGSTDMPSKGSNPFSATNDFLRGAGLAGVDWTLPLARRPPARVVGRVATAPGRYFRRRLTS